MSTILGTLTTILSVDSTGAIIALSKFEKQVKATADKVAADANKINNSFKSTQGVLAGTNSALQRFGYLATSTFTLPLVLASKSVFKLAKDYEFAMQKIVGLTGVAQESVNQWSKQILELGPQLGKSPQELIDALYYISSSGIKGAEAMDVLKLSAKAAASGLGETSDVANYLTSALNAYRDSGLTAAYATDVLVAGVREGKSEAKGFANAVGQLIPFASNLGVSLDQVVGAMSAITLTGSTAASASVYLKGVFNSLMIAGKDGGKALEKVGLNYEQLRKTLTKPTGIIEVMQKFREVQMKLGDEAIKDVLPNIRGMTAFMSIAGKNFAYNTELMKRVTEATGSLGKAWSAVSNTIKIKFDRAISQANVSMITLGKSVAGAFLPLLEKLVRRLEEITKWFDGLSESQKRNKLAFLAFLAVLGPASLLLSGFVWILRGFIATLDLATKAYYVLRAAMLANPYTVILGLVGALAGAYLLLKSSILQAAGAQERLNKLRSNASDRQSEQKGINDKLLVISSMDKPQLETFKTDLEQRREILKDDLLKLQAFMRNWYVDDKGYQTLVSNLISNQASLDKWKNKLEAGGGWNAALTVDEFTKQVANDKKAITDYVNAYQAGLDRSSVTINGWLADTESTITRVIGKLDQFKPGEIAAAKAAETAAKFAADQEEINKIFQKLADGELYIARMTKLLGKEFDTAGEKTKLYKDILEALANTSLPITDKRMRQLADAATLINSQVKKIDWETIRSAMGLRHGLQPMGTLMTPTVSETVESVTNGLIKQREAVQVLANAFEDLFTGAGNGFQNMVDSFIEGMKKLAAEILAKAVVWGILSLITGGAAGTLMNFLGFSKGVNKVHPMASGGTVPGGYPNDTYPALLSSGETVLPKNISNLRLQPAMLSGDVRFVIEENQLVGILKKANTRKSLY